MVGSRFGVVSDQPMTPTGHPVAQLCDRLGARLDEVGDPGLWSVGDGELAELVRGLETQLRRLQAWQTKAVAEARRRDLAKTVGATSTTAWLGDLLTARRAAAARVDVLASLLDRTHPCGHRLGGTGAAFAAGRIDADQARVIAEAVHALPATLGAEVIGQGEQLMLDWAAHHAAPVLNGYAQHLLAHLAPDLVEQAEADALARADARDTHRANTLTANPDHRGRIRLRGELDPTVLGTGLSQHWNRSPNPAASRAPDGATDHRTAGSATPTPWSRSAAAPSPPTRPRPASGSPPTSRSPSATTSSRPPSASAPSTPAPPSPPRTSAATPATPPSSPSC